MDELSDVDLKWQGLSAQQYDGLDNDSKNFAKIRINSFKHLKSMALVAKVLECVRVELGEGSSPKLEPLFSGNFPKAVKFVRDAVRDYVRSGEADIESFYNRRCVGKIAKILAEGGAAGKKIMVQPHVELSHEDRIKELALLISQWEERSPDIIEKIERDTLERIIQIADENSKKGLVDSDICLAAEDLVSDQEHPAQFPLETLDDEHRKQLLKVALKHKAMREK